MIRERRRKSRKEFQEFLKCGDPQNASEIDALERLMRESHDNPEVFHEEWLGPLLREGLSMDRAYDLLVDGTIRPN